MRSLGAMSTSVISDKGRILNATIGGLEDRYPNTYTPIPVRRRQCAYLHETGRETRERKPMVGAYSSSSVFR